MSGAKTGKAEVSGTLGQKSSSASSAGWRGHFLGQKLQLGPGSFSWLGPHPRIPRGAGTLAWVGPGEVATPGRAALFPERGSATGCAREPGWPPAPASTELAGRGRLGAGGRALPSDGHSVAFFRKLQCPAPLLSALVSRFFFRFEFSFSWWFFSVSSSASEHLSLT